MIDMYRRAPTNTPGPVTMAYGRPGEGYYSQRRPGMDQDVLVNFVNLQKLLGCLSGYFRAVCTQHFLLYAVVFFTSVKDDNNIKFISNISPLAWDFNIYISGHELNEWLRMSRIPEVSCNNWVRHECWKDNIRNGFLASTVSGPLVCFYGVSTVSNDEKFSKDLPKLGFLWFPQNQIELATIVWVKNLEQAETLTAIFTAQYISVLMIHLLWTYCLYMNRCKVALCCPVGLCALSGPVCRQGTCRVKYRLASSVSSYLSKRTQFHKLHNEAMVTIPFVIIYYSKYKTLSSTLFSIQCWIM